MPISIPHYLLESSICLALFYAFYHFLLRRETFFQLNRAYLLLMPLFSLAIPLINIQLSANAPSPTVEALYPIVMQAQDVQYEVWQRLEEPTPAFSLSLADLLLGIYLLGAGLMAFTLGRGLWRLYRLIRRSRRQREGDLTVLQPDTDLPASSFFSYIFWKGEDIPESKRIILEHELVHVRQRHSLDVLLMELWVIIKWFNPLIYLYRNSLQATHEYIADRYVARQIGSAYQYATFLASQNMADSCHPLTNTFAAFIRKRLVMLGRNDSRRWQAWKYTLCLPVSAVLFLLFSFNLSDHIPGEGLRKAESFLQEMGEKEVLSILGDAPEARPEYLDWGGIRIPLTPVERRPEIHTEVIRISPEAFQKLRRISPQLAGQGMAFEAKRLEATLYQEGLPMLALAQNNNGTDWMEGFPERDFSFYFRAEDAWDRAAMAVFIVSGFEAYSLPEEFLGLASESILNVKEGGGDFCVFLREETATYIGPEQLIQQEDAYLSWGSRYFQLSWLTDPDNSEDKSWARNSVSPKGLQKLLSETPLLFHHKQQRTLTRISIAVEQDGEALHTFESTEMAGRDNWPAAARETLARARAGQSVVLLFKDANGNAFAAYFDLQAEDGAQPHIGLSAYSQEKISDYSRRVVMEPQLPVPVFRHSGMAIHWGELSVAMVRHSNPDASGVKGTAFAGPEQLRSILRSPLAVYQGEYPRTARDLVYIGMYHPETEEWEVLVEGFRKDNLDEYAILKPLLREKIMEKVGEGYSRINFLAFLEPREEAGSQNSFALTIELGTEEPSFTEAAGEGISLSPGGIYPFQLINRPGERTLIKMDTTNEKYRWMYEQYKDGKTLDVVHIPGFKTIKRAVTLSEVILPEPEIGRVELLQSQTYDIDRLSEFYNFYGQTVRLAWRGFLGTDDQSVIPLKGFQESAARDMQLTVGEEKLPIRQVELLLIPESGKAVKLIAGSAEQPEVLQAIEQLQPKSSIYVTNLVVEQNGEDLLFPLTFAFNLK